MKIAVFGAGIIGVSSAWWLARAGHEVEVIERRPGAALETSRANGGQISVCYAEPWASAHTLRKVLRWIGRSDAPLRVSPRLEPRQWLWCARFLNECRASRFTANLRAMVSLARYSRATLREMRAELGIEYDHLERGILAFYRDPQAFEHAQVSAAQMRELGVDRRIVDAAEVLRIEPALAASREPIIGGDFTADDESGDVHQFTRALAERAQGAGVRFRYDTRVNRLIPVEGRISVAELIGPDGTFQSLHADAYVLALGSFTPQLAAPLGLSCPVWPAKGYSATFRLRDPAAAPMVSLVDQESKLVFSRLGDRLRMAGTAEIGGYSRVLDTGRCNRLVEQARALFPSALDFANVQFWSGLRPTTPSNVPLIGRTRIRNLYLNTGHGSLGWTMGAGSGRVLADLVSGRAPDIDFPFLD
ncbi:MAG: D-amino acid dehydrogenase [Castellaniella sp.]|uniref:D-amino acid dehydrogenase n=1 Tax=Castellaniella sp. TaxID=1955812 RepID=UPI002A367EF2|nr:D-amino acid dehydrogenase [Castellaniella sp.]MDY0308517.1 D-amino acid dehydrogenase [Castellaniella sp.]